MFHFKSWLMVTPSNLALVTNSRGLPFRTRGSKSWLLLENPILVLIPDIFTGVALLMCFFCVHMLNDQNTVILP